MSVRTFYRQSDRVHTVVFRTAVPDTFCDFPECLSWAENGTSSVSRNDARNKAEAAGWTYKRWYGEYYDMCPRHKDKNPRDEEISS